MRIEDLSDDDRQGLIALARALFELDAVDDVYLTLPSGDSKPYLLDVIISQRCIDAARTGSPSRETSLEMTLRIADYSGTEDTFIAITGDERAVRLWDAGLVSIWPFAVVEISAAPYVYSVDDEDDGGDERFLERRT